MENVIGDHDCMIVRFTSTYDGCHDHDCMIVRFTSTYGGCHDHDCMIVRFTSTYDGCHDHDCMIVRFTSHNGEKKKDKRTNHYCITTRPQNFCGFGLKEDIYFLLIFYSAV